MRRKQRYTADTTIKQSRNLAIRLLYAEGYAKSVSLQRLKHQNRTARRFASLARNETKPDAVLCSWPTIELAEAAVAYGKQQEVPVVLDVRDLWPDLFVDLAPSPLRWLARLGLTRQFNQAREVLLSADAIIGTTQEYVNWGLRHAGRPATALDRPFSMAYRSVVPSEAAQREARIFWRQHGVRADGDFNVCFFGTIGRHFDLDTVVKAAQQLHAKRSNVRFILCGAGDGLAKLQNEASHCPNIVFPGWIGSAEIWQLMQMSAVGLAPYQNSANFVANLPNKPIEYLSAGLPVVSALQGVLARTLSQHDCGFTYCDGDVQALVGTLTTLSQDNERLDALSRNAAALFKSEFDAENVYTQLGKYLSKVAGINTIELTPVSSAA
jgi:glycosyltransferase involved in cell wall biosynthesis